MIGKLSTALLSAAVAAKCIESNAMYVRTSSVPFLTLGDCSNNFVAEESKVEMAKLIGVNSFLTLT